MKNFAQFHPRWRGNLASEGVVAKITGKEGMRFTGTARVFNSEEAALERILDGTIKKGDVVVITKLPAPDKL